MAMKTTRKGFRTRCPFCGSEDTLTLSLDDVQTLNCADCDTEITPDDLRAVMAGWERLLSWLETAPEYAAAD